MGEFADSDIDIGCHAEHACSPDKTFGEVLQHARGNATDRFLVETEVAERNARDEQDGC